MSTATAAASPGTRPFARPDPSQYCFGDGPIRPLRRDEELLAPFEDRLRSIWPYLVKQVTKFLTGLSGKERANYGPDDLMDEVALALLKKDARWDPKRGRYITFADQVCRTTLLSARPRMKTVHAPSNCSGRIEIYRVRAASGTLSAAQATILRRIEQVMAPIDDIDWTPAEEASLVSSALPVPEGIGRAAEVEDADRRLRDVLRRAGPLQVLVLTRLHGLFGLEPQTPRAIGASLRGRRYNAARVLELADEALAFLKAAHADTPGLDEEESP